MQFMGDECDQLDRDDITISMGLKGLAVSVVEPFEFQYAFESTDGTFNRGAAIVKFGKTGQMLREIPVDLRGFCSVDPQGSSVFGCGRASLPACLRAGQIGISMPGVENRPYPDVLLSMPVTSGQNHWMVGYTDRHTRRIDMLDPSGRVFSIFSVPRIDGTQHLSL